MRASYHLLCLFCAIIFVIQSPPIEAKSLSISVEHNDNTYTTQLTTTLSIKPTTLYKLLTQYNELSRYSQLIKHSELLRSDTVYFELESCFGFFCFTKKQTMRLTTNTFSIFGTIIPSKSDFSDGWVQWQITPNETGSRIHFESAMEPKFWVPPFIGPWLIKKKLEEEALFSIQAIEQSAIKERLTSY